MSGKLKIGVAGSGAMGSGIAQLALVSGHEVIVYDSNGDALMHAAKNISGTLDKLTEKGKITAEQSAAAKSAVTYSPAMQKLAGCGLIIEAIIEDAGAKKKLFAALESHVSDTCILATNTSSLSVTSIASSCNKPERVAGMHFFNPAAIMPLVEIIPGVATGEEALKTCKAVADSWGKTTVIARDTPGFIVNRVARPYYSEALRIYDEGIATPSEIDAAMKSEGQFRMGPFELMDMIGHDVNYVVTETVWKELYYDPRFRPSLTQKRLMEAGRLGRKSGQGFYDYRNGATPPAATTEKEKANLIFRRILCMLVNEAADALYLQVASREDLDLAMTKGVNYPKGLLKWGDEYGLHNIMEELEALHEWYGDDRYRVSPGIKQRVKDKKLFYPQH